MKNKRILCAALLAAAASLTTGCQKEEVGPEVPEVPAKGMPVYVEAMTGDTKLRTLGVIVEWENGDQIAIGPKSDYTTQKQFYDITVSGSDVSVDYTPDATAKVAFFPKNLPAYTSNSGVIGAKVPSEYTVRRTSTVSVSGTIHNRNHIDLPMFAQMPANPSSITFQHLTGCIYLYVKNPTSKELILDEVELTHSHRKLSGTVNFASMNIPVNTNTLSDRTVKVVYPDGLSIPAGGEVRNVQVPVLPIDASNNGKLTLKIKCHTAPTYTNVYFKATPDVHVFEYTAPSPTVARNQLVITKVNFDYENDPNNRITTTKGGFPVDNNGTHVLIASTNLRWKAETDRESAYFTFASPSYAAWARLGNTPANTTDEYSGNGAYQTDLFGYGTNGNYYYTRAGIRHCATPDTKALYSALQYVFYSYPDCHLRDNGTATPSYDWGYKPIRHYSTETYITGRTFTMESDNWLYMLCGDNEYNDRRAWGRVNNVYGIILLPNNYEHPEGIAPIVPYTVTSRPNASNGVSATFSFSETDNRYTATQFNQMYKEGAVFIPVTGRRNTQNGSHEDADKGYYWCANQCAIYFKAGEIGVSQYGYDRGLSVRLAHDVE